METKNLFDFVSPCYECQYRFSGKLENYFNAHAKHLVKLLTKAVRL